MQPRFLPVFRAIVEGCASPEVGRAAPRPWPYWASVDELVDSLHATAAHGLPRRALPVHEFVRQH
eukprot:3144062-Lingulodinium_polyedra.AAC.1